MKAETQESFEISPVSWAKLCIVRYKVLGEDFDGEDEDEDDYDNGRTRSTVPAIGRNGRWSRVRS